MNKSILGVAVITAFTFMSCQKELASPRQSEISNANLALQTETAPGAAEAGSRAADEAMGIEEEGTEGKDGKKDGKKGKSKYEKVITKPIEKLEDCDYVVAGTITYYLKGETVAVVDFGDGTCDEWATKTVDGKEYTFSMEKDTDKDGDKSDDESGKDGDKDTDKDYDKDGKDYDKDGDKDWSDKKKDGKDYDKDKSDDDKDVDKDGKDYDKDGKDGEKDGKDGKDYGDKYDKSGKKKK